ncbi:branched-chain amino acid aminotransferase [Roseibacterium sp. SDUM158016]|jgi:branched-chain amino acid aminotransferase|uniref:branched-chain amino acid aminotransferase n=1 Tax=Roseicyclus sediminis TaxID=2980997 RepID=UPI0021D36E4C|nr:branched-chain amino acid aminotransferase [Roseibacterium sp. SDUM158016]MCU4654400.1 branched-chain amino acid aminotransferase [Roseibacterium sp. SDUM158016]
MATGTNIRTYFEGRWHEGDVAIMRAADHGSWLGTTVFDGARYVDGLAPDLKAHCERVVASAHALMLHPAQSPQEIFDIVQEGLRLYPKDAAVYIRPMFWGIEGGHMGILPGEAPAGFCVCLEEVPMAKPGAASRLTTTQFRRPVLADAVCNAKAGCLYPNNARMLAEARSKGYDNTLVADALGNVAETASANIFMVRDGVVFTPIPNGTFLAGITRKRHIANLRADGVEVVETVLTFDDFRHADEVFMTGNLNKVTPVAEFDGTHYQQGPMAKKARDLYWDWAHSGAD